MRSLPLLVTLALALALVTLLPGSALAAGPGSTTLVSRPDGLAALPGVRQQQLRAGLAQPRRSLRGLHLAGGRLRPGRRPSGAERVRARHEERHDDLG